MQSKNGCQKNGMGKVYQCGQTCIAPDYILVHKSIENQFLELLKFEIKKEKFSIENGNYTQIINIKI